MKKVLKESVVLTFVVIGSAIIGGLETISDKDEQDANVNIRSRRFLVIHNSNMPWTSWRQHVACLTTCVKRYEAETVACCTTGDNRLCFNLPFGLLNSSIGSCPDFCQRKSAINCGTALDQVCGSDGVTYANICELSKAICTNDTLREAKNGPCLQVTTPITTAVTLTSTAAVTLTSSPAVTLTSTPAVTLTSTPAVTLTSTPAVTPTPTEAVTLDPLFQLFCDNKDIVTCSGGVDIVCDSNKHFHKNSCEFEKLRCDNRSLTSMPVSFCRSKK